MRKQKRLLAWGIATAGIMSILTAAIFTPEFVAHYLTIDSYISSDRFEALRNLRLFSFLIGCLLLLIGIISLKFPEYTRDVIKRPAGTMFILIAGWLITAFINFVMKTAGLNVGTPVFFPFSEVSGPRINFSGIKYTVLFLTALFISLKYSERFNVFHVWSAGLLLILLGNLAQGGIDEAFYKPFNAPFYYQGAPHYQQYYHEAIKISDWREWLGSFNAQQTNLLLHTRTHPPFAILIHYFFIKISGNSMPVLAGSFVFLSSLSIVLIFQIMRGLEASKQSAVQSALLFSVIPAYNIYSVVSLDGVIVSAAAMFLLGLILILKRRRSVLGMILFAAGIVTANLFTFLALFMAATAGLVALREAFINKNRKVLWALFVCLAAAAFLHLMMKHLYGYDHVQAFRTAAGLEPKSVLENPLRYVMTRLENVTMLAIFLSFGVCAALFHPSYLKLRIFDLRDDINPIFIAGIIPVLLFFLIGGLYTGEGARILLFVYPFFLLLLREIDERLLRFLIITAGIQTIVMQTLGGYFW